MQDSHTLPPEKVHLHSFPLYMITSLCVMCLGSSLNCSFFLFFFLITMHDSLVVYLKDISVQIVADMPPLTCAGTCLSISPQLTSYGSFHLSIYILYFVHLYAVFFWRILAPLLSPQMAAECGPLHPQEQPGRTISLDVSSDTYLLFEDQKFAVKAFRLFHRIPSFGFCIQERDRPGRLKTELLKELGERHFLFF